MIAVVCLLLGLAVLGLLFFIVRFIAALVLLVVSTLLFVTIAAYSLSFLGFYFILGNGNVGWAIFGGMVMGTSIVANVIKKAQHLICNARMDHR